MAEYPCDFHLARYSGPSTRAYLNLYREEEEIKLKASICGDCLADVVAGWLTRALSQDAHGAWNPLDDQSELDGLWNAVPQRSGRLNGYRRP